MIRLPLYVLISTLYNFLIGSLQRTNQKVVQSRRINKIGYALYAAQIGKMHEHAKVLSGMGNAKVIEIRENGRSGTYRVIYTVEMKDFIFVLHAFQKKSKSGIATPKQELDLLRERLKDARVIFKRLVEKNK